jgi:bifunctional polynucleotide phosphatase/kinase
MDLTDVMFPKEGSFMILAELENKPIVSRSLIAAFDLDHTLIKPKSGNKFPKNYDDWILLSGVKEKLNKLYEDNYKLVVFTNQGSTSFDLNEFTRKIYSISAALDLPLQVFGSTESGYCRKPAVGMWVLLTENNDSIEIDITNSFYVGDAAGRKGDFADTDLKFALNIGLKFYCDIKMEDRVFERPIHPLDQACDQACDQVCDPVIKPSDSQEMIIFVGPPAAGKSTTSKKFPNYVIACQDTLKTKAKVISTAKTALKAGSSVIIDRKNEYIEDRTEFINIAKEYKVPVRIIWFDIIRSLSEHLATYREIITYKHIPQIVFNKYYSKEKGLQVPTEKEGAKVIKVHFKKDLSEIKNKTLFTSYLT